MKKGLCTKLTASITLALAAAAYAQPANDNCSGALTMVDGTNAWDNTGATQEVTIGCAFGGAANSGLDVWYDYTATTTGPTNFEVLTFTTGDSTLAIFDACGGTELACDDDGGLGLLSLISGFPTVAGTTYKIRLSGWGNPGGQGSGTLLIGSLAAPANDVCSGATPMSDGDNAWSNIGATQEVTASCTVGGPANSGLDVWYTYTAPVTGTRNFEVTAFTTGDSVLSIFDACGGTELACDDDNGLGLLSLISNFPVTAGTTYRIRLAGWGNPGGTGSGNLNIAEPLPPATNDTCATATAVTSGSSTPFAITAGNNTEVVPSCGFNGQFDLWYSYTNTGSGSVDLQVDTFGSGFDTILNAFDACGGTEIACNDDSGSLQSFINIPVNAGQTVFLAVHGYNGATGTGTLNVNAVVPTPFDSCSLATPVAGQVTVAFDTNGLTTDGTGCTGTIDGWYAWTPSATGLGVVQTCGLTGDDTTLSAYDTCGGLAIACVDDFCGVQSSINFPVVAGNTYLVRLASFFGVGMTGQIQFDVPPPPANDACSGAIAASIGTTTYDSTAATSDGLFASCAFGGTPDNADVWFSYTAGSESFIGVDTFGSGIFDTTLVIYDSCSGTELACNDDAGTGLQSQICNFPVVTGTTYFIRVASWGATSAGGAGLINIETSTGPVPFNPPAEAVAEDEVCGTDPDVDNGGCNSIPEVYDDISLCDTIKGTGFFDGATRDTDWYRITVDADTTLTVTGESQFSPLVAILQLNPDCTGIGFIAFDQPSAGCNGFASYSISGPVTAGEYIIFVAPQFAANVVCGEGDQYWFNVTGSEPCGPTCNDIDFNNDGGFFDPTDVDAFLSVFSEGPCIPATATCDDVDFNNDGGLFDPCDIDSFLLVFSEGPCTNCGF